MMKHKTNLSY